MSVETIYLVYCSTCNKNIKSKMSWKQYLKYMAFDGRSKGYHEISSALIKGNEPTQCPFGHPIYTNLTTTKN